MKRSQRISIKRLYTVILILAGSVVAAHGAEPTHKDVRYSRKYERSVLDIWTVKSDKPAPLVVNFHGGGFTRGDKKSFYRSPFIKKYHPKGVAFATVNYPFREHTGNSIRAILQHTAEAIKFLGTNARKYNIDPRRISVTGASAGALISGYLGYGAKLPIRSVFAIQQPMGTPAMIVPILHRGGPSIVVYNTSGPGDRVHHPDNAKAVYDRCKKVGVYCEIYGSKRSGLPEVPEGEDIHDIVMKVFYKSWRLPHPDEKKPEPPIRKPKVTTRPRPKPTSRPKRTDDQRARSQLALAKSYIDAGLKAKAVDTLKQLITKYPKTQAAKTAAAELAKLGKQ